MNRVQNSFQELVNTLINLESCLLTWWIFEVVVQTILWAWWCSGVCLKFSCQKTPQGINQTLLAYTRCIKQPKLFDPRNNVSRVCTKVVTPECFASGSLPPMILPVSHWRQNSSNKGYRRNTMFWPLAHLSLLHRCFRAHMSLLRLRCQIRSLART